MKFGFILPRGDARTAADFGRDAETAGWDGFFVYEPVWGVDAWVSLTAAAMQTRSIRLGTMLSPLSRMRPWKLAGETATLDQLSGGRVILSVGLGALDTGFAAFGEVTDRKIRAELLDEGLEILTGLWQGQPFHFSGKHYQVTETNFEPPPPLVQSPRIPIWVVGAWPRSKSMQRVARYDGLLPVKLSASSSFENVKPQDISQMKVWIKARRPQSTPFDIVMENDVSNPLNEKSWESIHAYAAAGVTWWLQSMWTNSDLDQVLAWIRKGPPRGD